MGTIKKYRQYPNLYEQTLNAGGLSLLPTVNKGFSGILSFADGVNTPTSNTVLLTVPFEYQVSTNSLMVFLYDPASPALSMVPIKALAEDLPNFNADPTPYFEEVDSTHILIHEADEIRALDANVELVAVLPHTATPASTSEAVVINKQGSGVGIELLGNGDGISLRSPNGKVFTLKVDDDGHQYIQE